MTTREFIVTRSGKVHVAQCGQGMPILLLHQTPRSWTEYRAVLPLLGRSYRAIAMDTRGFGDSDPLPPKSLSIEGWADAALDLVDALGLDQFAVVGHHTGAYIALELAVRAPNRVTALITSAMSYIDADRRAQHTGKRVVDEVDPRPDGSHLSELWMRRQPVYPVEGGADLLEAYMIDALKAGYEMAAEGHRVVNRYEMETRIGLVRCPTLVLAPTEDVHSYPSSRRVADSIIGAELQDVPGAMVPFPDQMPQEFANAVIGFLERNGPKN